MLGRRADRQPDGRTDVSLTPSRFVGNLLGILRKIAGMPDYDAHIEHLRRCHPEIPIPNEREFYSDFLRARYEDGPTRCC